MGSDSGVLASKPSALAISANSALVMLQAAHSVGSWPKTVCVGSLRKSPKPSSANGGFASPAVYPEAEIAAVSVNGVVGLVPVKVTTPPAAVAVTRLLSGRLVTGSAVMAALTLAAIAVPMLAGVSPGAAG